MSGEGLGNRLVGVSAQESRAQAATWLERHHREDWSPDDQLEFDTWLSKSPANLIAYVRVETAWKRADRLTVLHRPGFAKTPSSPGRRRALSIAAACVAGVLATGALIGVSVSPTKSVSRIAVYTTGVGGHKTISLSDGTQIELNTNSTVRIGSGNNSRQAWLDKGEAYFRIAHDSAHPFIVFVGDRRITDLGTRFSVRKYQDHLEVSLVEGRAVFDAPGSTSAAPVVLSPGDTVTEHGRSTVVTRKSLDELSDRLGWRRGILIFRHTTLAQAAEEFNRYNTSKLAIADAETAQLTIGGSFQSDNIGVFARSMRRLLGVHIETHGTETVISHK